MKNIGCIMRLFVVGYLLFQANCVNSAELTKIKIGENPRGGNCPAMEEKRDGKMSILKYKNNAWIKVGETWTDGGNWEDPCMEDADKILSKMYGD